MTIAAVAPFVELLISDRPLSTRAIIAASLIGLGAMANALKAFLSQSIGNQEPVPVVSPPGKPLLTHETGSTLQSAKELESTLEEQANESH